MTSNSPVDAPRMSWMSSSGRTGREPSSTSTGSDIFSVARSTRAPQA
eukprot:CAMPEP_0119421586 /NCGR_PEP_ID=MMETSP1335-20130426/26226_1 /TAXON_ID=259385 /ORGANISM="Chrysoculter rhomboideus, Strain RCC1486" /LENGTH=46 /DNA_ID= /DNA_START= /DNA_END= /DNA_ORIENTATION=